MSPERLSLYHTTDDVVDDVDNNTMIVERGDPKSWSQSYIISFDFSSISFDFHFHFITIIIPFPLGPKVDRVIE